MRPSEPSLYTDVSQEQFDRFRTQARARGLSISGNSDNITFDLIPLHVEYKPDEETLRLTIHEPHWLAPGVTAGVLHTMIAEAMRPEAAPAEAENPQAARQKTRTAKQTSRSSHPTSISHGRKTAHAAKRR